MKNKTSQTITLYFGALSGLTFITVTLILGKLLGDYNSLSQTVSEIGQVGSPFQRPYTLMLLSVSLFGLIFSYKALEFTKTYSLSKAPIVLIASFALLDAGFAIFPSPEPMHNIIGLLHLFGYFSPLVAAIAWRRYFSEQKTTNYSGFAFFIIIFLLALNLSPMFSPTLYPIEYYGVVQRGLLYSYYLWLTWLSMIMATRIKNDLLGASATNLTSS